MPKLASLKRLSAGQIVGWIFFILAASLVLWFLWRILYFTGLLRSGTAVYALPQFSARTSSILGTPILSAKKVSKSFLEDPASPSLGDAISPDLTIVEFADFECPFSRNASLTVRSLMAKYGDRVQIIFRHYPIETLHPGAGRVATAAACANEQGKFWAYHDKAFAANSYTPDDLTRFAAEVGLDMATFERCLISGQAQVQVQKDLEAARTLGLRGTPTFMFDGQTVEGDIPPDVFESIIQRFLTSK